MKKLLFIEKRITLRQNSEMRIEEFIYEYLRLITHV